MEETRGEQNSDNSFAPHRRKECGVLGIGIAPVFFQAGMWWKEVLKSCCELASLKYVAILYKRGLNGCPIYCMEFIRLGRNRFVISVGAGWAEVAGG